MPPAAGGRGGPVGGRGRPPQRRSARRRRRNTEELEPTQLTVYTPSNAPVPEHEVIVERGLTAQELGPKLNRSAGDVIRFLLLQGEIVTATQSLSDDMVELFAAELGARIRLVDPGEEEEAELQARYFEDEPLDDGELEPRPPVVTVMGHVDHGKTLLLDRIRETNVVAGEAGGITQHIGAYQAVYDGHLITFIDTPGHEAFTAMRARGAQVTDVVVLVVAADDGVMPQTVEAIDHAKAAGVPIVVAINKIDREDADPNRVRQQLSEHGLVPEAWGGDTITVEISALQGLGIDDLLEQLLVLSEVLELKASPEGRAKGIVLEANLDPGRGPVATVLVQHGSLHVGDHLVAGSAWGRVKAMLDHRGEQIKIAGPSTPVQVLGFNDVPAAGEELRVTPDQATARAIGEARSQRARSAMHQATPTGKAGARLEDLFEQIQRGETAILNLIVKADVQGSLEALSESLRKLERDDVKLSFVHRAVGGITENDVHLAAASGATIIGFNVRPDRRSREAAEAARVEIRTYDIIYKVVEDIQAAMVGMLAPEFEEVVTGEAEVRQVFRVPRVGAVAGCLVRNGVITRGSKVRFLRDGVVIWKGAISSLKRFKEDAREVQAGFECGIGLSDFQDLKEGDVIETYEEREIPRS
jgi:translation initiation factor IF-2